MFSFISNSNYLMPIEIERARTIVENFPISILTCNVQSINQSFERLKDLIHELGYPEITACSEIWQPKINISIKNYHAPVTHIRSTTGGGIAIYISEKLTFTPYRQINDLNTSHIEKMATEITMENNSTIIFISIYRSPSNNIKQGLVEIKALLDIACSSSKAVIITGDINLDVMKDEHNTRIYQDILQYFQCQQLVTEHTRITSTTKTLIDHAIVNSKIKTAEAHVISASIADHLPTLLTIGKQREKPPKLAIQRIKINYNKLVTELQNNTITITEDANCNEAFDELHENIKKALQKSQYKQNKSDQPRNPWILAETIELGKKVSRLRKKFLNNNTCYNEFQYKQTKKEHQKMCRCNKQDYYQSQFQNCRGNIRKTWGLINEALNRKISTDEKRKEKFNINGTLVTNNIEICNNFNSFYRDIAVSIANEIGKPEKTLEHFLRKSKSPSEQFQLIEVSETEVLKIVNSLPNKTSSGHDGISNKCMKKIIQYILKDLTMIINKSIREECFPDSLKISKISPIFKKSDRTDMNNWRPIAELMTFSKIFENLVVNQLTEQLDQQGIIDENQFGFRAKHSVLYPLMITKTYIENELSKKKHIVTLSIDLKKAFDCCQHDILKKKLKYYTGSDKLVNWITSFYTNRQQYCSWDNNNSKMLKNHPISIVQGSSLGPRIFNIYSNDFPMINNFVTVMFADDATMNFSHEDPAILEQIVNDELQIIKEYFDVNGLSINTSKTTFLHFSPKNNKGYEISLQIGNKNILESEELDFLGVTLDRKMKFKTHFNKIYKKAKQGLNGLIMTKRLLDYKSKIKVYHSLVHSHFNYCALIWISNITKKQLDMLTKLQKKAIRLVHGVKYNAHTDRYFKESRITKVKNIFEKESMLLTHKYLQKKITTSNDKTL